MGEGLYHPNNDSVSIGYFPCLRPHNEDSRPVSLERGTTVEKSYDPGITESGGVDTGPSWKLE
jgi:hypothetical protein